MTSMEPSAARLGEMEGLKDVFNLAVGKVYEYIKSELMPKFLVSEHFRKVKRGVGAARGWVV